MTDEGRQAVVALRPVLNSLIDNYPSEVQCGTGRRQWEVAQALGYDARRELLHVSGIWGDPSTIVQWKGLDSKTVKKVLLSHGEMIDYELYDTARHVGGTVIREVIASLQNNTVICSGRPVLVRLGIKLEECHSGALYSLAVSESGQIEISLRREGSILLKS